MRQASVHYHNIAGKNDCPAISGTISNEQNNNYKYAKSFIQGSPLSIGQTCGNEGTNVYTSKLIENPTKTYVGCYNDKYNPLNKNNLGFSEPTGGTSLIDGLKSKTVFGTKMIDDCTRYATENNYKYFAMQKNADTTYKCTAFNSSNTNDYDIYSDALVNTKITSFNILTSPSASSSSSSSSSSGIGLKLLNTGQIQLYDLMSSSVKVTVPNTPENMCIKSGNISISSSNFSCKPIEGFINMFNTSITEGFSFRGATRSVSQAVSNASSAAAKAIVG
jgi:hypothetical protein